MKLSRYTQAGALFADALNSIRDLENLGYTKTGTPTVVDSPFGRAICFSTGSNFNLGTLTSGSAKTVLVRINYSGIATSIWNNSSAYLSVIADVLTSFGFTAPTLYVDGAVATAVDGGQWYTIGVTDTTAFSISTMVIGSIGSSIIEMRDLMLFDRVLSAAEILSINNSTAMDFMRVIHENYDAAGGLTYTPFSSAQITKIAANTKSDNSSLGLTVIQLAAFNAEYNS